MSQLNQMESNETRLLPTEIVAGVLATLRNQGGRESIPTRKAEIHRAFYEMHKQGLSLVSDFRFDTSGTFPYSPTLEQATNNLATCLLLERNNPKLNLYLLTDKLETYFESEVKRHVPDAQFDEMKAIAKQVQSALSN